MTNPAFRIGQSLRSRSGFLHPKSREKILLRRIAYNPLKSIVSDERMAII